MVSRSLLLGGALVCALCQTVAAQPQHPLPLDLLSTKQVTVPDYGAGGAAVELDLEAQVLPELSVAADVTGVRVRKGTSMDTVQFKTAKAEAVETPSPSDAAGFLWGKPMSVQLVLCGQYPGFSHHTARWSLDVADAQFRATGGDVPEPGDESYYELGLSYDGTLRHRFVFWGLAPLEIDVEDLITGAVEQLQGFPAGPEFLALLEERP